MPEHRRIELRREINGADQRFLDASLNWSGDLIIEGHDLGPSTTPVSSDGEYEWIRTIRAGDIPALMSLLGASPDADVLDVLRDQWSGTASYELERLIRHGNVPSELSVWTG